MNQPKPKLILLLFLILVLLLSACSVSNTRSGSHSRADSRFAHETITDTIELEIKPAMTSHNLDFTLAVEAGQLSAELTNPQGEVHWAEVFQAPAKFDETFALDLIVGHWTLKINLEDASGSYSVRWEGRN